MNVKDGYRFIQGLLPAKTHREFTELSKRLKQPRSETLRNAIDAFLLNPSCKCKDGKNG